MLDEELDELNWEFTESEKCCRECYSPLLDRRQTLQLDFNELVNTQKIIRGDIMTIMIF